MAEKLAGELDRVLLRLLRDGVPLINRRTRQPVLGDDGKPVLVPPSAPYLSVVRARVKDLERGGGRARSAPAALSLIEEARRRGLVYRGGPSRRHDDDDGDAGAG